MLVALSFLQTKICLLAAAFSCSFGVVLGQMWRVSLGVKKKETTHKRRVSNVKIELVGFASYDVQIQWWFSNVFTLPLCLPD